jgi:hypothetical protein
MDSSRDVDDRFKQLHVGNHHERKNYHNKNQNNFSRAANGVQNPRRSNEGSLRNQSISDKHHTSNHNTFNRSRRSQNHQVSNSLERSGSNRMKHPQQPKSTREIGIQSVSKDIDNSLACQVVNTSEIAISTHEPPKTAEISVSVTPSKSLSNESSSSSSWAGLFVKPSSQNGSISAQSSTLSSLSTISSPILSPTVPESDIKSPAADQSPQIMPNVKSNSVAASEKDNPNAYKLGGK